MSEYESGGCSSRLALLSSYGCQGFVVVANVPLTPPMVRVVEVKVKFVDADVWRTRTVSPLLTVPEAVDHDPLLILYSLELGPLTEIDAGELIPLTVMASEVRVWFRFTF